MINTVINDRCQNVISQIKHDYKDIVIITDPPYNIQFKYYKNYSDNLTDKEYISILSLFKDLPSAIIQYPEETMKYVVPALGVPIEVLAWCYSSNLSRQFRLVNIYRRQPDFSKVLQNYKNKTDNRVKKLISEGRKTPMYDWFNDIQLVKNVSKEKTEHACPVPVQLMSRIIKIFTTKNDIVVDPFMGTGTTVLASMENDRRYIGIEMNKEYCNIAKKRIRKWRKDNKREMVIFK